MILERTKKHKKKYEQDLKVYNEAVRQNEEWKQAERIFLKKGRYDPRSSVGRKITKMYEFREKAMEDMAYYKSKVEQFKGTIMTSEGGVSTAFPEKYGVVPTEHGFISTAFPKQDKVEIFKPIKQVQINPLTNRPYPAPTFKKQKPFQEVREKFQAFRQRYENTFFGEILWATQLRKQAEERGGRLIATPVAVGGTRAVQITKALSKTKFDKLKKLFTKVEKDVALKETQKEKWDYLLKMYKQLKTGEEKAGFKIFVQGLFEKQILKVPTSQSVFTTTRFVAPPTQVPSITTTGLFGTTGLFFKPITKVVPKTTDVEKVLLKITPEFKTKQKQISFLGYKIPQLQVQKPKQIQRQKQIQKEKQKLKITQILRQRQVQKQLQRQRQVQRQRIQQKIPIRFKIPQSFKTPTPILKRGIGIKKEDIFLEPITKEKEFSILGRRFGEFSVLGKARTREKAKKILKTFLTRTLGASGKILRRGKAISDINLGLGYRKGKRDISLIVQRKKQRLGTREEVTEILGAKKSKRRKIKWL